MAPFGFAVIVTVGTTTGLTVNVIVLLVAVGTVVQERLLVRMQYIA
jgi:hypothetical protein